MPDSSGRLAHRAIGLARASATFHLHASFPLRIAHPFEGWRSRMAHVRSRHISRFVALTAAASSVFLASSLALADGPSTGANGINSQAVPETGNGARIGQVEQTRPGKPGFDNAANSNADVAPFQVFLKAGPATANGAGEMDVHAEEVAGVMIGTNAVHKGVAPQATLLSARTSPPAAPRCRSAMPCSPCRTSLR
jgi:hypothetical protein